VLRVARIVDPSGRYYLEGLGEELEAGDGRRDPPDGHDGRWLGGAADGLGLCGRVDPGGFTAILSGRHPSGGHALRRRMATVCGYDLTFAASKSVSALFALSGPARATAVRRAHEEAVDAATGYVAGHAAAVRCTTPDGRTTGPAGGVVAACFTHVVSRSLDPHLHSHVIVANLARGADGRWRAIDSRGLYAHARAAGAVYDAVLRHGVTARLGLEWAPRPAQRWELSCMDPVVLGAFSSRRAEILVHLAERSPRATGTRGSPSGRARTVAWAATRDTKSPTPPVADLRARWRAVARDAGWSGMLVVGAPARRAGHGDLDEHRFASAISGDGRRAVARRDVVAAWASALDVGATGDDVARCVDALADWADGTGVAERVHAPATVVPPPDVLRLLGPRPSSPGRLDVWRSAAASIAGYRARWDVRDAGSALGPATATELRALPTRRLADLLTTRRQVDDALSRLGRARERDRRLEMSRGLTREVW
jgi:conjugative relaxase-like TrwC/TraI family protein